MSDATALGGKASRPSDAASEVEQAGVLQRLELAQRTPQPIRIGSVDVFTEVVFAIVEVAERRSAHGRGS